MTWDYELARRIRAGQERREAPAGLEGEVVRTDPLTVSLYGGEVMAPPAPPEGGGTRPGVHGRPTRHQEAVLERGGPGSVLLDGEKRSHIGPIDVR